MFNKSNLKMLSQTKSCNVLLQRLYGQLSEAMEECALSHPSATASFDRVPGIDCIVDYPGRRGGNFCRGVIVNIIPENHRYVCHLPDECIKVEVHSFQVLPTNPSVTAFPEMVRIDFVCFSRINS